VKSLSILVLGMTLALGACDRGAPTTVATSPQAAQPTQPAESLSEAEVAQQAQQVRTLIRVLIANLQRQNFEAAAGQFHLDPSYDDDARAREIRNVAARLWAVDTQLGGFTTASPAGAAGPRVDFAVDSNPDVYWDGFEPEARAAAHLATTYGLAPATLSVNLLRYGGQWQIARIDCSVAEGIAAETALAIDKLAAHRLSSGG
jgi:hypothetical protein